MSMAAQKHATLVFIIDISLYKMLSDPHGIVHALTSRGKQLDAAMHEAIEA